MNDYDLDFNFEDYEPEQPIKKKKAQKAPTSGFSTDDFSFNFQDYEPEPEVEQEITPQPEPTLEKPKEAPGFFGTIADVAKQGAKGLVSGAVGAAGDIFNLIGEYLDTEEDEPPLFKGALPSSKQIASGIESLTGIGEAKTSAGRFASRIGTTTGAGVASGGITPAALLGGAAAGAAGQAVEEFGGSPLAQSAAEIASLVLSRGKDARAGDVTKKVSQKISDLRKLGYSDKEITMAVSAANKGGVLAKTATKGETTKKAFEDITERSQDLISDLIEKSIPGAEKGSEFIHKVSREAYGHVSDKAKGFAVKNTTPFSGTVLDIAEEIGSKHFKDEKLAKFAENLVNAGAAFEKNPTADKMIDIYKELNSVGKWTDPKRQERLITNAKDALKKSLSSSGKEGQALLEDFEKVNLGVQKAYRAEKALTILDKAKTQEGIDFKKMSKIFDDTKKVNTIQKALGPEQTNNLKLIAKTGSEIKDFDKAWKGTTSLISIKDTFLGLAGLQAIYEGDWIKLGGIASLKGASLISKKLAEKSLTDPRFQRIQIKAMHALKSSSPQQLLSAQRAMDKYLKDEEIEE